MDSGFSLLYITCPDSACAERLSRLVIEAKLAACANIVSGMSAIYPWEGKIATGDEIVLLLKTRKFLVTLAIAIVEANHPYNVPAILEIPLGQISAPYKKWLEEETL